MKSKMAHDRGARRPSLSAVSPSTVSPPGLEGALTFRALAYLRSAHGMTGEAALEAATLSARRALAATPHWRLERAGLAVIEEAARLAKRPQGVLTVPLMVLPEGAPRAMPEQNLDRAGLGDLRGGTRRVRRRLRVRLRAIGGTPTLILAALMGLLVLPGSTH